MNVIATDQRPVLFHLITGFGIGGAERLLERLLPRVTEFRHVVISLRGEGPIRADFERAGVHTEILRMGLPFSPLAFFRFRRLVRRDHPLILNTCLAHADIIGRFWGKLCGIPYVTCYLVARYRGKRFRTLVWFMALTDRFVDRYVAVSAEVKRFFTADLGLRESKFTVIVNSVDPTAFTPRHDPDRRRKLLAELHLPAEALIVGTVSNLREEKCIDRLIAALPTAFAGHRLGYCVIVGDGADRVKLEEQVKRIHLVERVRFLRFWPNLTDLLPEFDIFVLPSRSEGMSMALLEAMATGCAIIVTDTPEHQEVLTPGTGLLVDTADPDKLGRAISLLLKNTSQREDLGTQARRRVEQHFSLNQSASELTTFFRQFLSPA